MKRRKFWLRAAGIVVVLLVLVRFIGVALIPSVLNSVLSDMGFTSEIEEIQVSVLSGEFQLRGLVVREIDSDAAPLIRVQHVALDLDMSSTLLGDPVCNRAELDGVVVVLHRDVARGWNFASLLAGESAEAEPSASELTAKGAFDLRLPIKIVSLRAQDLHLRIQDPVSEPSINTELTLNMTASNLGDDEREGQFEAIADATGLLDFLRVEGIVDSQETSASLRASMTMSGVHVNPLAAWIEPLGLRSTADSIDVRGELTLNAAVVGDDNETLTVTLDTHDWVVEADSVEALALDSSHHVIDLGALAIRESVLTGVRARTALEPDGAIAVAGVAWRAVSGGVSEAPPEQAAPSPSSEPLAWRVDSLQIREGSLIHTDVNSDTNVELRLDGFDLTDVDSEASRIAKLEVSLSAPGLFDSLLVQGELTPGPEAVSLDGAFDLSGFSAERCQAMLEPTGIALRFSEAKAHGSLAATIKRGELAGSGELSDLWLQNGEQRTALDTVRVDSFVFGDEIQVGHVLVAGLHGVLELHENGDIEVGGLVLSAGMPQQDSDPVPELANVEPQTVARAKRPIIKLDHFECSELKLAFVDHDVPERSFAATRFQLDVNDFAFGTESNCSINLRAGFDAWCEAIELDGTLHSTSEGDLDCDLDFRLAGLQGEQFALLLPSASLAFDTGEFATHIGAQLRQSDDGLVASFGMNDLALTLDAEQIVSLMAMSVDELALASDGLRLRGARLDAARLLLHGQEAGRTSTLMFDAGIGALRIGASESTTLSAQIGIEGDPAVVEIFGEIRPDLKDLLLKLNFAATGVDGARLNHLLPPSVQVALKDGTFGADVEAWFKVHQAGGLAGGFAVDDVHLGEVGEEAPLLAVKRVEVSASKIDVAADLYELGRLHVLGAELTALREADGALNVAGLRLDMSGAAQVEEPSVPDAEVPQVVSSAPRWVRKYDTAPLPTVSFESVEFELAALRFEDQGNPGSVPATLTARFHHEEPLVLLAPDAETHAPLEFLIDCSAQPIVEAANVQITLAPWEEDARFKVEMAASGVQGEGVTDLLPQLNEMLDGGGLVDGSLGATFEGRLITPRRNLLDFEFRNGFGVEFSARDLVFLNGGEEIPLASLGAFEVDVERIDPQTGAMKIESIDFSDLQARVELSEEGRELCGFILKPTTASDSSESQEEAAPESSGGPYDGPEIQLERLSVSGLDFVITDTRTEPVTVVPFDSLGFDLEQFTTKTFTEPRPFRFAFFTGAGDMSLPKPKEARSALAGIAGAALSAATGSEDEHEYEQRPALGEIAVTGNLSLGPEPRGRVNANIEGLELLGFSGLARESGVIIGSGVLDAWMRVKLKGEKGVDVRSNIAFTDLSLDEPPNGPISRYLKLPASLDTVLFAIKNNEDQHRIPLSFHVDGAELGKGEIARVAVTTLTKVITSAVASAPLRAADGVAGMLVIPGVDESPVSWVVDLITPVLRIVGLADKAGPQSEPVVLEYAAGEFVLDTAAMELLAPLFEEVEDREDFIVCIEHKFGSEDEARASQLANPSKEECRRLVIGLRRRKRALSRHRAECAADLAASYAVNGQEGAGDELKQLRAVEAELGGIELALDETLGMLRPGSDRHAARRTRATLIEIAEARMGTLQNALSSEMKGRITDRFEIKTARPSATSGADRAHVRVALKMKQDQ